MIFPIFRHRIDTFDSHQLKSPYQRLPCPFFFNILFIFLTFYRDFKRDFSRAVMADDESVSDAIGRGATDE